MDAFCQDTKWQRALAGPEKVQDSGLCGRLRNAELWHSMPQLSRQPKLLNLPRNQHVLEGFRIIQCSISRKAVRTSFPKSVPAARHRTSVRGKVRSCLGAMSRPKSRERSGQSHSSPPEAKSESRWLSKVASVPRGPMNQVHQKCPGNA